MVFRAGKCNFIVRHKKKKRVGKSFHNGIRILQPVRSRDSPHEFWVEWTFARGLNCSVSYKPNFDSRGAENLGKEGKKSLPAFFRCIFLFTRKVFPWNVRTKLGNRQRTSFRKSLFPRVEKVLQQPSRNFPPKNGVRSAYHDSGMVLRLSRPF